MADTAAARLAAAVKDKPDKALAAVSAADVVEVGKSVTTHTKVSDALTAGAAQIVAAWPDFEPDHPRLTVYQYAGQVRELLDLAGGG